MTNGCDSAVRYGKDLWDKTKTTTLPRSDARICVREYSRAPREEFVGDSRASENGDCRLYSSKEPRLL